MLILVLFPNIVLKKDIKNTKHINNTIVVPIITDFMADYTKNTSVVMLQPQCLRVVRGNRCKNGLVIDCSCG